MTSADDPPGRARRFVDRYGWRAYALPVLTLATLGCLLALTVAEPAPTRPGSATAGLLAEGEAPPTATAPGAAPSSGPAAAPSPRYVEQGTGTLSVVAGTGPIHEGGPLRRFVVEVEGGLGVDPAAFAAAVEGTLADPRSWGHGGQLAFQRVGAEAARTGGHDFRVALVSPGSMERWCPGVGTAGYTSCRYGERAVINLARWETAVPDYAGDVATYREYVVNHEVGHALGRRHERCAGPGRTAPVMQQQTLGLDGCVKNAWPYP